MNGGKHARPFDKVLEVNHKIRDEAEESQPSEPDVGARGFFHPRLRIDFRGSNVMVCVGSAAPHFECTTVVDGHLVQLSWQQLHEDKTLVLLFDPIDGTAHSPEYLIAVCNTVARLSQPHTKVAVVWRNDPRETLAWANRPPSEGGPGALAFPLIADPAGHIAELYDPLAAGRTPLWHRFLIDPAGRVRQAAVASFPVYASVEDLLRIIQAIGCPADRS